MQRGELGSESVKIKIKFHPSPLLPPSVVLGVTNDNLWSSCSKVFVEKKNKWKIMPI